jgi:CRP/FNR family transcriptional regulator, anaerobic regulatory protein
VTIQEFSAIFPYLKDASEGLAKTLLSVSVRKGFPAGLQIYTEGDACQSIAFIMSGEIRVYKAGLTGREITLYEIGPGETCILNASCILSGMSYPANAVTLCPVEVLLVPAPEFRRLISQYPEMRTFVFTLLSHRLSAVMELVEEVAFGRMDERLMEYIIEKSEEGRLQATHHKIASDLGTSREVVSRLLKNFELRGALRLSRNLIEIVNP